MAEYQGILICGEVIEGKVTTTAKELLNIGSRLSDNLNQPLSALLIGKDLHEVAKEIVTLGAEKVYTVDGSPFAESHPDFYVGVLIEACQQLAPSIILLGQNDMGRDVAPRLAARMGTTITLDCVDLSIDPDTKSLLQTRLVYGGRALAVWASQLDQPQIVTMRPRAVPPAEPDTSRQGEVVPLDIAVDESMIKGKLLEVVREEVKGIKLEEAETIVGGGGGIGGSEGFKLLEELAQILGGAVGMTTVPFDEGWVPTTSFVIGQSGRAVKPNLYIAVGLRGAPQHMTGCSESKYIVAINKDPDAPIFNMADFGVVADYRKALPPLIEKCKALLAV